MAPTEGRLARPERWWGFRRGSPESGHTAYHQVSLIDLCLHAKFRWNWKNVFWTDVQTVIETSFFDLKRLKVRTNQQRKEWRVTMLLITVNGGQHIVTWQSQRWHSVPTTRVQHVSAVALFPIRQRWLRKCRDGPTRVRLRPSPTACTHNTHYIAHNSHTSFFIS